jgi:hypothetical protein
VGSGLAEEGERAVVGVVEEAVEGSVSEDWCCGSCSTLSASSSKIWNVV